MTRTLEEQLTSLGDAVQAELTTDFAADVISLDDHRPIRDFIFPAVAALVLVVGGLFLVSELSQARRTVVAGAPTSESAAITSAEPLPAPILVEDMIIDLVVRPWGPDFDADDLFGPVEISDDEAELREQQEQQFGGTIETVIYGDPDDPFNNPIFGITIFDDDSFQAISANLDAAGFGDLENQIVDSGGEVSLPTSSGLTEVARVTIDTFDTSDYAWTFFFGATNRTVDTFADLTAMTGPDAGELSEWTWISRLLSRGSEASTETIEVLGQQGVLITYTDERPNQLVWVDVEAAYRFELRSFDSPELGRSGEALASQLMLVDRADWVQAVIDSGPERDTLSTRVLILLSLVGTAAFYLVYWRRSETKVL